MLDVLVSFSLRWCAWIVLYPKRRTWNDHFFIYIQRIASLSLVTEISIDKSKFCHLRQTAHFSSLRVNCMQTVTQTSMWQWWASVLLSPPMSKERYFLQGRDCYVNKQKLKGWQAMLTHEHSWLPHYLILSCILVCNHCSRAVAWWPTPICVHLHPGCMPMTTSSTIDGLAFRGDLSVWAYWSLRCSEKKCSVELNCSLSVICMSADCAWEVLVLEFILVRLRTIIKALVVIFWCFWAK